MDVVTGSSLRVRGVVGFVVLATSVACNAITGTGRYDIVDCPNGACGDAAAGSGDGASVGDGGRGTTDASADANDGATNVTCTGSTAPLTLTVTGTAGSVSAKTGGTLTVASGETRTACLLADTIELRTNGGIADWTGPSCKDGNVGRDRCELDLSPSGATVTVALR